MLIKTRFSRCKPGVRKRELPRFRDRLRFTSAEDGSCILHLVASSMERRGYDHKEVFGVRLALEEALVNAVKHGNRHDPTKCVRASWHVGPNRVMLEIEDEGDGFDPRAVPDPCATETLERSCGRGVFLMRHYMSSVRYNRRGNRVTMCMRRAQPEGDRSRSVRRCLTPVATNGHRASAGNAASAARIVVGMCRILTEYAAETSDCHADQGLRITASPE